jgi:glycosyltransferase involved in cell wall biosynthesis
MAGSRKRKFLFVSAPFGGIEVFFKNIQRIVAERKDIDATWVWIEYRPKELISKIPPFSFNWTLKGGIVARCRIKELERAGNTFDAVLFNHIIPTSFLAHFRKRVPMFLSLDVTPAVLAPLSRWYRGRGIERIAHLLSINDNRARSVYKDAVHIFAWSNLVHASLVKDYKTNPEKVSVLPPGINLNHWNTRPEKYPTSKVPQEPVKILFVGGEFRRKGGDLLVRIAGRKEFQNIEFHFVTRTFLGTAGRNCYIYNDVKANSVELMELYQKADIFVLPTRADLAPTMAICEAMAAGLPVIAAHLGGLEEIVRNGETGYTVPVDDEEKLADAIRMLAVDRKLRLNLGRNARALIEEKYNLEKNVDEILRFMTLASESQDESEGMFRNESERMRER